MGMGPKRLGEEEAGLLLRVRLLSAMMSGFYNNKNFQVNNEIKNLGFLRDELERQKGWMIMKVKQLFCSFAEAMRAGIPLGPQTFDRFGGAYGASCALGAGLRGLGVSARADYVKQIFRQHYPYMLRARRIHCPASHVLDKQCLQNSLQDMVMHLNDYHRWTREKIADWLYAEEEKLGFITLENVPETQVARESRDSVVTPEFAGVLT